MNLRLWESTAPPYRRPSFAELDSRPKNGLVAASTFSGAGGSSLGLRSAGWAVPYANEFVPAAAETYAANFPSTYVDRRDVRRVSGADVRLILEGEPDLLEGSPPCASFSAAGARARHWGAVKKYSDVRQRVDDLFWEWVRLLGELRPRALIAENVPGMLVGRALEEYTWKVVAAISELGYRVVGKVVNSAWYGVPTSRNRLIFVGFRRDVHEEPFEFPRPTVAEPRTLREALDDVGELDPEEVAEASIREKAIGRTWEAIVEARRSGREFASISSPCARCGEPLAKHSELGFSASGSLVSALCLDGDEALIAKDYFMLVVPELDEPAPTITATAGEVGAASITHPTEPRKLTSAELLSISGFPKGFRLTGTYAQRRERIGRAVTPFLYEEIGRAIAGVLVDPAPRRTAGQIADDREADLAAARDGHNPNR